MSLQPVTENPGLWRAGLANAPGVHALIIGISDYPYLSDGSAPKAERALNDGGLGQLEVSALSGAMFFEWLLSAGSVAGAPLASCRLHLAPRPGELDRVKAISQNHFGAADYATLRTALEKWTDEMAFPGRTTQSPNVALFFYSGHGVEVLASPAILASDVLTQLAADGGRNKAAKVDTLMTAVKTYNIDRGLFFVDACRNAPLAARLINLVGDEPLKPNLEPMRRPDALIGLRSTASGLQSYQAKDEAGTLFTQAVLNGLKGPPPNFIPYDRTCLPWTLKFAALEGHVKRMVIELLKDHNPQKIQTVEPYGNPYNGGTIIANKEPPLDAKDLPRPDRTEIPTIKDAITISAASVLKTAKSLDFNVIAEKRQPDFNSTIGDLFSHSIMHEVLGHEEATISWFKSLCYLDARTGKKVSPRSFMFASHSQQIGDRIVAWLDLSIAPGKGELLWIGTNGADGVPGSAVVIPRDLLHPMPVRLDVQFDRSGADWQVTRMSARLADPTAANVFMPDSWTALFEAQKTEAFADLASAARPIEEQFDQLQQVLSEKRESPIAAAFATNLLLRASGTAYLRDWPRNLANWFEWLADGPVLWAETLLRERDSESLNLADPKVREALQYFLKLANRGVPTLADTLVLAVRQAALWREFSPSDALTSDEQSNLRAALEYIDRASLYAVSGIGFARFMSTLADFAPEQALGAGYQTEAEDEGDQNQTTAS
jgi:hypothetical protein